MCAKNQWESDILQEFHDINDLSRKHLEQARYHERLENTCLLDGYMKGDLALIVNFNVTLEAVNMDIGIERKSSSKEFLTVLLYYDCIDSRVRGKFESQQMFVRDIEMVKDVQMSAVSRSLVGLYFGVHPVNEIRADAAVGDMFFSVVQGRFDTMPFLMDGESQVASFNRWNSRQDKRGPCNIERGTEIVNRVSDNGRQSPQMLLKVWNLVYEALNSSLSIGLDCRSLTFFERDNSILHVNDVLIGPFNLQERIADNCTHNVR